MSLWFGRPTGALASDRLASGAPPTLFTTFDIVLACGWTISFHDRINENCLLQVSLSGGIPQEWAATEAPGFALGSLPLNAAWPDAP